LCKRKLVYLAAQDFNYRLFEWTRAQY